MAYLPAPIGLHQSKKGCRKTHVQKSGKQLFSSWMLDYNHWSGMVSGIRGASNNTAKNLERPSLEATGKGCWELSQKSSACQDKAGGRLVASYNFYFWGDRGVGETEFWRWWKDQFLWAVAAYVIMHNRNMIGAKIVFVIFWWGYVVDNVLGAKEFLGKEQFWR